MRIRKQASDAHTDIVNKGTGTRPSPKGNRNANDNGEASKKLAELEKLLRTVINKDQPAEVALVETKPTRTAPWNLPSQASKAPIDDKDDE